MSTENPLVKELAEYRETILELKVTDPYFRRLLGEYEHIEDEIAHGGEQPETVAAPDMERLQSHHRSLREHILQMIRCAEPLMV
jgi:uncharacterized protein YdcH (DUF465 family)